MKYKTSSFMSGKEILFTDHHVAFPYDCSALTSLATNNVIPAGTIIPSNDANALGVLLNPVYLDENPNGTVIYHGFIAVDKLPAVPASTAITALKGRIMFMNNNSQTVGKCKMIYDGNGGTGSVTDSASPYDFGATVTVKASTGLTPPSSKTFKGWALSADATEPDGAYDANDTFVITGDTTLYAVWG